MLTHLSNALRAPPGRVGVAPGPSWPGAALLPGAVMRAAGLRQLLLFTRTLTRGAHSCGAARHGRGEGTS